MKRKCLRGAFALGVIAVCTVVCMACATNYAMEKMDGEPDYIEDFGSDVIKEELDGEPDFMIQRTRFDAQYRDAIDLKKIYNNAAEGVWYRITVNGTPAEYFVMKPSDDVTLVADNALLIFQRIPEDKKQKIVAKWEAEKQKKEAVASGRIQEDVIRGQEYSRKGDYDRAIAEYTEAIRKNPNHPFLYITRGRAYSNKGDYDKAIADFNEALRINPNYANAYNDRGTAYSGKGDYDRAIADYDRAIAEYTESIRKNPDHAFLYVSRSSAYSNKGDYDKAIADYNEALRIEPNNAGAYKNRGDMYSKMGDYDRAIADFTEVLRIGPSNAANRPDTYSRRGDMYSKIGDYDKAIADYNEALRINPDNADVQRLLAEARQQAEIKANPQQQPPDDAFGVTQNSDNTITITGYKGTAKNIIIPATLFGLKVTIIGEGAFSHRELVGAVIPNTVTEIRDEAFYRVSGLKTVTIGSAVITIGRRAFAGSPLSEIIIPDSVTVIMDEAFCESNNNLFKGNLTKVQLGRSLKTIGFSAFSVHKITSLVIPNGVTYVGSGAFSDNPLTELVIPPSLARYEEKPGSVLGLAVKDQTTGISYAFENCPLTRVTIPANMDERNMRSFEDGLVNFWRNQNKAAGTYVKNGPIWTRQ